MQYRDLGKTGEKVSVLGFGCMRLPVNDGKRISGDINEKEATMLLHRAIDEGVNYVDTGYHYHDSQSENFIGRALKDGYRNKVKLATKSPVYAIKKAEEFDLILNEQLNRLKTDYIDFYLMHSVSKGTWEKVVVGLELLPMAEKAKKEGKIGHIGFSFHDNEQAFYDIVNGYEGWEFCQIQFNYLNEEYQAGLRGLKYASSKGLGVVIMEPLLGGKLANPSQKVSPIFENAHVRKSPVQWALDYVWDMPEVSLLLSGMNAMEQVEENLVYAEAAKAGKLSSQDKEVIAALQKRFKEIGGVPCTRCFYCMPCPNGVDIPKNFEIYNGLFMYDSPKITKGDYIFFAHSTDNRQTAENCVGCLVCEDKCPQHIKIAATMEEIRKTFAN